MLLISHGGRLFCESASHASYASRASFLSTPVLLLPCDRLELLNMDICESEYINYLKCELLAAFPLMLQDTNVKAYDKE